MPTRTYLTGRERDLAQRLLADGLLVATRAYPHDWKWKIGATDIDASVVAGLVEQGCGWVRPGSMHGDLERQRFVLNRDGCLEALKRKRPPRDDPDQINWIPDDHPARLERRRVRKSES